MKKRDLFKVLILVILILIYGEFNRQVGFKQGLEVNEDI